MRTVSLTSLWQEFILPSHGGQFSERPSTFVQEMRVAAGPVSVWPEKAVNAGLTVANHLRPGLWHDRLRKMRRNGVAGLEVLPTRLQIMGGAAVMVWGVVIPDYDAFSFRCHTNPHKKDVLRFLMDPSTELDPTGLSIPSPINLFRHLVQTDHREAIYDFQLFSMWDDPTLIDQFITFVEQVRDDTHARAKEFGLTAERRAYFDAVIKYATAYRDTKGHPEPMSREGVHTYIDPYNRNLTQQFRDLPGFIRYCLALPKDLRELASEVFSLVSG